MLDTVTGVLSAAGISHDIYCDVETDPPLENVTDCAGHCASCGADLDIPRDAIPGMAEAAMKITRLLGNNPRHVTQQDAVSIYEQAY